MKSKIISKVLAMGLAGTLALSSPVTSTVFAEGYDTTAPVVTDITLDKDTVEAGNTITFDVNVTEDETGISSMYLVVNGEVVNVTITPDGSAVSGKYTASYTIPEDAKPGEYHIDDIFCKDIAGNESHNADFYSKTFTVTNKNYIEDQAPVLEDSYPESETLEVPGTQVIDVICHDDDLTSISIDTQWTSDYTSSTEFNKHIEFNVSEISEDGVYKVEIPYTDNLISGTFNYSIDLTDKAGNTSNCLGKSFNVVNTTEEPDIDTVPPVVTSITTDTKDSITLPGVGSITISGTEDKASSVSGYVTIGNTEATGTSLYVNFTAPVVDGKWSATETFSLDQNAKAGIYKTLWMSVTDANTCTYSTEALPCSWSVGHESEDIAVETTLNNPNIVDTLKNMDEGQTAVVRTTTTNVAPAEVFKAIKGEDKNVVFDEDGIQWVFNGQNISDENIKDVDLSVDIENSEDLTDLGYEEGSTGTILNFAPNGVLPGKCVVRLKSDYISDKYNLDSELYLACIRKTVEYQEEIKYTDLEWPTDEDGNPIYETTSYVYDENGAIEYENKLLYDEDGNPIYEALKDEQGNTLVDSNGNTLYSSEQAYEKVPKTITTSIEPKLVEKIKYVNESKEQQVQIEDVGIKMDSNGFINITMTHNSSYVLSADLPKVVVDNTNNNDKNNINNSQNSNTNESINSGNTTYDIRSTAPTIDSKDNGSVIRSTNNDDVNKINISSSDNNKRSISTDPKSIESVKSPITGDSNNPLYATIFVALIGGLLLVINTTKL